jgi:hypothetical protein
LIITGSTHANDERGIYGSDIWLIKTDLYGDTVWTHEYGGSGWDAGYYVEQTSDGGYIVAGFTMSFGAGGQDLYLIKTDANGDTLWTHTYGGSEWDIGTAVHQLSDGGFVIAGYTASSGPTGANLWMVRTDSLGSELWSHPYGTNQGDWAQAVEPTSDGGFILAGHSFGFASNRSAIYLVKTDAEGTVEWINHYLGVGSEYAADVLESSSGGYLVQGWTSSLGGGGKDMYLLKTDADGNYLWDRAYGGPADDGSEGYASLLEMADGGLVMVGHTASFGDVDGDIWLVRTDAAGDTVRTWVIEQSGADNARSIVHAGGDDFVITGYATNSDQETSLYLARVTFPDRGCCGEYTGGYTGNCNCSADGIINLADIGRLIDHVYISQTDLCCAANGDINGDMLGPDLADIIRLIDRVYLSKAPTSTCP